MSHGSQNVLKSFVTDLESDVFCLKNLPPEVVSWLFGKYSRSTKGLRETLAELLSPSAGDSTISELEVEFPWMKTLLSNSAEMHKKYTLGYGHTSLMDHAVIHICVEKVSIFAAKVLEDPRLAAYVEKSTRYVDFSTAQYYTPPNAPSPYHEVTKYLIEQYTAFCEMMTAHFKETNPEATDVQIRSRVFDIARGILPANMFTSLGMTMNAKSLVRSLQKWFVSPYDEIRDLAEKILAQASLICPNLLKHARDVSVWDSVEAEIHTKTGFSTYGTYLEPDGEYNDELLVRAVTRDPSSAPVESGVIESVRQMFAQTTVHHPPSRALEQFGFNVGIRCDFGAWRDIQRHRMWTPLNFPDRTWNNHWYVHPDLLHLDHHATTYLSVLARARSTSQMYRNTDQSVAKFAHYLVPMAGRVQVYYHTNLRQLIYFCMLRSQRQGHPSYRFVAQVLADELYTFFPILKNNIGVDHTLHYEFARK